MSVKLSNGSTLPIEMHKARIVQKIELLPAKERVRAMVESGYNTFLLKSRDVFLDMLTDSGTNAMSDKQLAAMMSCDDAYAGSESFYALVESVREVMGMPLVLPVHQGRAAEHLLSKAFIKPGDVIPMNYHFTTNEALFGLAGATIVEVYTDEALNTQGNAPFRGNMDVDKLKALIEKHGAKRIPFVRMEACTNLLGGQPFSMANLRAVRELAGSYGIPVVCDGSLLSENAYFIKVREPGYADKSLRDVLTEMMSLVDIMYMSARKSTCVRGGLMAMHRQEHYDRLLPWIPIYEGSATYGGMSTKEIAALAVGLREMCDMNVAGISPQFISYFVERMNKAGLPAVTPAGALAAHLDASRFLPDIPQIEYPAGALSAAIYLTAGIRTMERGTLSTPRDADGNEVMGDLELARLALPRRVYTASHIEYAVDRLTWLYQHRNLVKGLRWIQEPPTMRWFLGKLEPLQDWGVQLASAVEKDFGPDN